MTKKNECLLCGHDMDTHKEIDDYIYGCPCGCVDFIQNMVGYNYTIDSLRQQKQRYDKSDLR